MAQLFYQKNLEKMYNGSGQILEKPIMATTTRTIEKGIRELTYNNKDGSKIIKYQVRIHTKELPNFNVLVESLEVAKEIVNNAKSSAGRELIKSLKIKANEPKKKTKEEKYNSLLNVFNNVTDDSILSEVLKDESLEVMMDLWYKTHIKRNTTNEVDLRNNRTYELSIKTICNTRVIDWFKQNRIIENVPINMRSMINDPKKVRIGDISIFDIDSRTWLEYINSRLETGKATSTVAREISMVCSMYNKLYLLGNRYKSIENPIDKTLKQKLKTFTKKRNVRLSLEDEIKLEKALREMRNEDMAFIFSLAISTGCRRSEILYWEWQHIHLDKNYYEQIRTKTGVAREIKLLPQSKKVLSILAEKRGNPKTGRLFSYTIDGFKSNWQRVREKADLPTLQFRDIRNEFISRFLEKTDNPIAVSAVANIQNQAYFNKIHTKAHVVSKMLKDDDLKPEFVQLQVGHSTPQMTAHYNRQDFNNDGSKEYLLEQLKLKLKFNKATPEEKEQLLMMMMEDNKD